MNTLNETLFTFFNSFALQYVWFDTLVVFFAQSLPWVLAIGVFVFFFFDKNKEGRLIRLALVLVSAFAATFVSDIIKEFVASPRPFLALSELNVLFIHGDMDSFPSGHATFFSALAVALYFHNKTIAHWFLAGAVLISISRVVAGIHWPIDILAGFALGAIVALVIGGAWIYAKRMWNTKKEPEENQSEV